MQILWQDLRYGARMLMKKPGFTLIAVLMLALGIGANTAIFTVVDAALLRSLPYKAPERLYHLWEATPQKEFSQREFSYPDYQDYQQNRVFEEIAAYRGDAALLTGRGEPELVMTPAAASNFFSMMGVEPVIGRAFRPGEDKPGAERVTVLTYGFWRRMFGGDAGIIGQALTIDGASYTVVGVLPANFQFALVPADLWLPYQPTEAQLTRRFLHGTNLIGRLKSGVSVEQAQAEMSAIASRIERDHNQSHAGTGVRIVPLREQLVGAVKPILMVLLGAVGFVLLIACANVASLLLTRSLARQKEVAIRSALGASRWRVVRQLLTESVTLSVVGGVAGLFLAYLGTGALVGMLPQNQIAALPFLANLHVDARMLAFSFALSVVTGVIFGLAPAIQSSRSELTGVLKEGGRNASAGSGHRLRTTLVVSEIALAVVLLVGSGLLLKSLFRLLQTSPGFNPQNILTMSVVLPAQKYSNPATQVVFNDQLCARAAAVPGAASVGTIDILPLQPGNTSSVYIDGEPVPPPGRELAANVRVISDNYFQTLQVPLIEGRPFDSRDKPNYPESVIIGSTMADRLFRGRSAVSPRLRYYSVEAPPMTIFGVVGDVKITGLDQELRPVMYFSFRQNPSIFSNLVVRTNADPTALTTSIRSTIQAIEPQAAIFNVQTMPDLISGTPAAFMRRFPATLVGVFAALALLLASIGIYGVVSDSVAQQTHYIGIRMALGARTADIVRMVLKEGLVLAAIGIGIGILTAFGLMRWISTLLFNVQTHDFSVFAIVTSSLFVVILFACYLPARRA